MKRLLIAAALVLASIAAHADTSTYVWLGNGQWTDANCRQPRTFATSATASLKTAP